LRNACGYFVRNSKCQYGKTEVLFFFIEAISVCAYRNEISCVDFCASKHACYHHVVDVVIWKEMVIDYESVHTYPLTEDLLRQICHVNTTFRLALLVSVD
jgi:hypothetical protein